ncbi:MAG: filamentous hemagglutinin N-terminal domain-containing protein, partial [Thermodesulfobacteriota bacterium]|nr:filamentous hemagglutinin N-terminal domain-containing protein [Thermodesulfobacteriota bacterium]
MPKQYGSPTLLMGITMAFFLLITATAPLYAESGGGLTEDGLGTVVTPAGTTFDITGGTRPGGPTGSNLFHSFSQFNVENGETANFIGDSSLTNIFVRVTGGNNSWIDGTIKTTNTNANVYIMNPNGVMFGSNASFDANGSVYVSTADYVKLADDNRFYADVVKTSVLTTAAPAAFGFLATPGGNISVNGSHQLTVAVDKTLSLIGGDLLMDNGATLTAASGQVNLVSVASAGEVDISGTDPVMNGVTAQGDVTIRASSKIDVNGDGGGRVFIRGGNVVLENASIEAKTTGATAGLGVDIAASNTLTFTHSLIDTATGGTGNAGNVILSAADITLDGFGASADEVFIDTRTDGLANAGNITLTATNSITLDASGASAQIRIFADSLATPGLAGDLALNANSIIVQGQELFSLSSTATDAASIGTIGATASTITVDGQEGSLLVDKTGVGGFYVITNVILDGSLGPAQSVAGPAYTVQEAWGTVSGANLFHSAKKFIVDSGESVIFEHVDSIDRIIIRVTGGDVTTIDGAISASNGADVCIV